MSVRVGSLYIMQAVVALSAVARCNVWLALAILLLIYIFDRCLKNYHDNIFFMFFLVAFFVFLMGGQVTHEFFGIALSDTYTKSEYNYLNFAVFLSLSGLGTGFLLSKLGTGSGTPKPPKEEKTVPISLIKENGIFENVTLWSFYALVIPWFLMLIEQGMVVQGGSYLDYYSYRSRLPRAIYYLSNMCPYALCFFLAAMPAKKKARIPMLLVLIYAAMSLFIGRRMFFVVYILLILSYCIFRNIKAKDRKEEVWLTRRQIVLMILLLPVLLVFLYSYRYFRYGKQSDADNFFEAFLGFFAQQGYTANLIPLEHRYHSMLPNDFFSFYDTIKAVRQSFFVKNIMGLDFTYYYSGSREFMAQHSGSFARAISLKVMGGKYLYGYGTGSCYIAELLHDFSFWGVAIGNLIYGFFIGKLMTLKRTGAALGNGVALTMYMRLLMTPRYNFDYPFATILTGGFWLYLAALFIVCLVARAISANKEPGELAAGTADGGAGT